MISLDIILLLVGFVIIIKAADILVDSASAVALKFKIPKILIALTIASFGTSAPEIAISFQSISNGDSEMAFANVIGSSVVNILLIIGLASFIAPIKVKHATIKKELPILFLITTGFCILMLDSLFNPLTSDTFSRSDGIILMLLFSMFVVYLIQMLFHKNNESEDIKPKYTPGLAILLLGVSIVLIICSSDLIVESARSIAHNLNISEKIITMVAIVIGTSLPEMVTTITSAKKGEFDMAIGNIVGTNIFNICIVLGLPITIFGDITLTGFNFIDILMVFISSSCLYIFARSERTISKKEGFVMLLLFLVYYLYLLA